MDRSCIQPWQTHGASHLAQPTQTLTTVFTAARGPSRALDVSAHHTLSTEQLLHVYSGVKTTLQVHLPKQARGIGQLLRGARLPPDVQSSPVEFYSAISVHNPHSSVSLSVRLSLLRLSHPIVTIQY